MTKDDLWVETYIAKHDGSKNAETILRELKSIVLSLYVSKDFKKIRTLRSETVPYPQKGETWFSLNASDSEHDAFLKCANEHLKAKGIKVIRK